ncbi:MAG: family 3 adenylate cyclase [Anderseniella sp.]|nr:family 3 adenylate cyclase [Anderseniella sp.]
MKRMFYVSRFSRPLSKRDIEQIHGSAVRFNSQHGVTGILVCLGDTFFQVLEGKRAIINQLYHTRIVPDNRHFDVICLKSESGVSQRMFPEWDMRVFDLNDEAEALPMAFRQMLSALLESNYMIAQYTQPSILKMLENGVNPTTVKPRKKHVTVLFSDIIGFSQFAERLNPDDLIDLVNRHAQICIEQVDKNSGQVNKLLGDGVLTYFTDRGTDAALEAATGILKEMERQRRSARDGSPHQLLFAGVGLANGVAYEGNVGSELKRDFTILGNTVNQASRLESLTRRLNLRIIMSEAVVERASPSRNFISLGRHKLIGQSAAMEIFSLKSFAPLNIEKLYAQIDEMLSRS